MLRLPHPFAGEVVPELITFHKLPEWFSNMFDCVPDNDTNIAPKAAEINETELS